MFILASKQARNDSRLAAVLLALSLWLGLCALEVSPDLHHFLHRDAQSPTHNCLVTQLQHHSVLSGCAVTRIPIAPATWSWLGGCRDFRFYPFSDYRLSPSRAPPSA